MRSLLPLASLSVLLLASACVSSPRPPAAPSIRVVAPPPPAAPIVRPTDWRDWPQTPGDWRYERDAAGSIARFGSASAPLFAIRCSDARVILQVQTGGTGPLTIRTTGLARSVPMDETGSAAFGPQDPLLDAIGFSRGRFVAERAGAETLVMPAWAEVERVVEDCRG